MFFGLLGPLQVRADDGGELAVGGAGARALLGLLLLDGTVSLERIVTEVYGDTPPADAANAVQAQVSRLRRRLGAAELIVAHPAGYRCTAAPDDVDVHRFTALSRRGRDTLAAGRPDEAAPVLREALALWRGEALADLRDAPFAAAAAARLAEQRVDVAQDAAEAELLLGESAHLVAELTALVAAHPLRERLRVLLMRALRAQGRPADALAVFADARARLADELGADPSPELAAAHLDLLRGTEPAAPVLPAQFSSFVGRDDELRALADALGTARLVTVTGFGGAGKTRLAIEAAGRAGGEACFVDLAAVTQDAGLAPAVLAALGLRAEKLFGGGPSDAGERLLAALRDRELLLVLDNCEQVLTGVATLLHRLLAGCPRLRVLATSREALGIPGEVLRPLAPLPAEQAVALFAARAAAVRPGFVLDAANTPAVARLCAALDGLPLAIELAAARCGTLTPQQLADRLDDRFRLLSKGNRGAAVRHRTLYAVVEWSWDLLAEAEQRLFARLAVFAGGMDPAAVAAVCGLSDVDAEELLAGLAERSLLECVDGRYRMLETIRVFSAERLADTGERAALAAAHARHYLALARTADGYLRRAEQLTWLARLGTEHANLTAALRWCVDEDPRLGLELVGALSAYWRLRGLRGELAPLMSALLAGIGDEPPDGLTEEYLLCLLGASSEVDSATLARADALVRTMTGPLRQPYLMVIWALLAGPPDPAEPPNAFGAAFLASDDGWCRALAHFSASYLDIYAGDVHGADAEFAAALAGFRAIGDRWGIAQVLDGQAALADLRGELTRAIAITDEAIALVGELQATEDLAELECRRAERLARFGDLPGAIDGQRRADELARRTGVPAVLAMAHRGDAELALRHGDLAAAREHCARALDAAGGDWQSTAVRTRTLGTLARITAEDGDPAAAVHTHREALQLALSQLFPLDVADAAEGVAGALAATGAHADAVTVLGLVSRLRGGAGAVHAVLDTCRAALGEAAYAAAYGDPDALSVRAAVAALGVFTVAPSAPGTR